MAFQHQGNFPTVVAILVGAMLSQSDAVTIQDCPVSTFSINSPLEFGCEQFPTFTKKDGQPTVESVFITNGKSWTINLGTVVEMQSIGPCPVDLSDVECNVLRITIATTFDGKDGSTTSIDGEQRFGQVNLICSQKDDSSVSVVFVFFIKSTTNDEDSDISGTTVEFLKDVLQDDSDAFSGYTTNTNRMEVLKLLKFDQITDNSVVFYQQHSNPFSTSYGFVFASDDVAIKLSQTHYNTMTNSGNNNPLEAQTEAHVCDNTYKIFEETKPGNNDDDDDNDDDNDDDDDDDDDNDSDALTVPIKMTIFALFFLYVFNQA